LTSQCILNSQKINTVQIGMKSMIRGQVIKKLFIYVSTLIFAVALSGCIGEGVGRDGALAEGEDAPPEVSSTPTSFEFLSTANSLTAKNLKTDLVVSVKDAFGVSVDNVQVKFTLVDANDAKVIQLGKTSSGTEVVVLSKDGDATLEITAKATGNPSSEVTIKAELIGYGSIKAKTLKIFVKEIPLTFTVQDLPQVVFNRGVFEFVSIQVRDPDGNSVNGVPVTIVPVAGSPLRFYDIQTTLSGTTPSDSEQFSYVTEGDGLVSFNLWSNASSGTQPLTTNFNIRIGASSNQAVPSENIKIFFVQLTNVGSLDNLKANGHDTRTLSIRLDGTVDAADYYIRWKTTLGSVSGAGLTVAKKLPFSTFDPTTRIANATMSVANEFGDAEITGSLINNLADDNDLETVVAEITFTIKFVETKPVAVNIVVNNSSLVAGGGNIFTFTGQVIDKDGVGIDNITIPITVAGEVPLEVVSQVVSSTIDETRGAFRFNASAFNLSGRWTVTVKADTKTNSIAIEQLSDKPSAILVNDGKQPESIFVKGTGNKENTSVTFKVLDRFGNAISDNLGIKVVVSVASGPGGGEEVDPTIPTETVNGIVSANIRSGNRSGTVRVHAEIENNPTIAADTNISIAKGPLDASSINLEPDYNNIAGRHILFLEQNVTASLADAAGDAVPDGQGVTFVTKGTGNFFKNGTGNTLLGFATDTLVTAANPDPFFGFSVLTAEANGGEDVFVTSMAFLHNSDIVFAGTKGGGIKKSNSLDVGSVNWTDGNGDFAWVGQIINDLKIPEHTTSVFAATSSGLFKSTNLGSTWTSIRSELNNNRPGFVMRSLNTSTVTAIAFANEYLSNSSSSDPESLTRNPNDVDLLVGTNGEGIWYNNSRGESFSIVDADGTTTDGRAQNSATVIDGAFLSPFDIGVAPNLYYIRSASKTGFIHATNTGDASTFSWISVVPTGATLPTVSQFKASDGTGAIAVTSHRFPNLYYNDKNQDGGYDLGEEIVASGYIDPYFSGGWVQSGTLGTGGFINRLSSQKVNSTNYVIAATSEGVMASVGTSSVGAEWSNIGTNGDGIFIKKAKINDVYLKSDLTLYAATGEFGIYKFTGLSSISKTPATVSTGWSKLGTPKAGDTILSNVSGVTGKNDKVLSTLTASDRLFYKDSDSSGTFNGLDQIVIIPAGQVIPTIVVFGDETIDPLATYLPAETASAFLRYVDLNLDGSFTVSTDILVLDWNDNLVFDESSDQYQSFNAVIEHTFGSTAYIFAASSTGGVFFAPVSNTTSWMKLDIRDTNASAKRFYSQGGNLYICTAKKTEIIEISAISSTFIDTTTAIATSRNVSKGESGAGSIDTKIRGTSVLVSTGTITPTIEIFPAYNQYVQNLSNTVLYNELTQTQMLQLLIDNSMLRTGTLLRVSSTSNLQLTSTNNRTLVGTTSNALGTITFVGTSYVIVTPINSPTVFVALEGLYQPAATNANSSVISITTMSSLTTVAAINALLTNLGITLTGTNEQKNSQLISAGLISPTFTGSSGIINNYSTATLLLLSRGLTDISKVEITNFATEEGVMQFYSKVSIEDSNGNPPVAGTKVTITIQEIQNDVDSTGVLATVSRTYVRFNYQYTYPDITNRGPGITQLYQKITPSAITRLPSSAPSPTVFDDTMQLIVLVESPSADQAPGNNGSGTDLTTYTISRSLFTPTGGGTLIRE